MTNAKLIPHRKNIHRNNQLTHAPPVYDRANAADAAPLVSLQGIDQELGPVQQNID